MYLANCKSRHLLLYKSFEKLYGYLVQIAGSQSRCGFERVPDVAQKFYPVHKKVDVVMEKQIERRLVRKIKEKNGLCLKLTGYKGIPDRIVLIDGRCYFVELKDVGKKLRPEQQVWQDKLQAMGFEAVMLDSKEAVDEFVEGVIKDGR